MDAQPIVQQAASAFSSGQYQAALELYKKASERLGEALFEGNIALCERRLTKEPPGSASQAPGSALEQQLHTTQHLLEYYFIRSQELEYQLLDK